MNNLNVSVFAMPSLWLITSFIYNWVNYTNEREKNAATWISFTVDLFYWFAIYLNGCYYFLYKIYQNFKRSCSFFCYCTTVRAFCPWPKTFEYSKHTQCNSNRDRPKNENTNDCTSIYKFPYIGCNSRILSFDFIHFSFFYPFFFRFYPFLFRFKFSRENSFVTTN